MKRVSLRTVRNQPPCRTALRFARATAQKTEQADKLTNVINSCIRLLQCTIATAALLFCVVIPVRAAAMGSRYDVFISHAGLHLL